MLPQEGISDLDRTQVVNHQGLPRRGDTPGDAMPDWDAHLPSHPLLTPLRRMDRQMLAVLRHEQRDLVLALPILLPRRDLARDEVHAELRQALAHC